MRAMILEHLAPLREEPSPLRLVDLPCPDVSPDELLIRVRVCGVCHTELDEIEGRLPPARLPMVLGHQVVGHVEARGSEVDRFRVGDRVGVGWIHHSSGEVDENLSPQFRATGCDVNGGYAEFMTVPEAYAVEIPENLTDDEAAPLLCAGAIGYRSLRLTSLVDGQPLGLMGFGSSAHLVIQTARYLFPNSPVYVFDRNESARDFALALGATWSGSISEPAPQPLRAVIDTTPAWLPVVESMNKLAPGGRLVINAIRKLDQDKESLLGLSYHQHLWMEREIKSVANLTYRDIAQFLPLAGQIPLRPTVTKFPLEDANEALRSLASGGVQGSHVLLVSDRSGPRQTSIAQGQ